MKVFKTNAKNVQTTIIGLVAVMVTVLVGLGKLTAEEGTEVKDLMTEIISSLAGLSLIFLAKD